MFYWNIGYSGMHRYYSCITLYYWWLNPVLVDFLELYTIASESIECG